MATFHDRAFIDGPARITREGHFVAAARVAKANNIQDYNAAEIGQPPKADGTPYRIFRPASEIFAKDSLASALHKTIVLDHPPQDVDAANWKSLSVGDTGGEVLRDGEVMSIPVMIMDAAGVKAVRSTHREFSWGYSADLVMTPGKFGDAAYDGSIKDVRYNHLAAVPSARGGHDLRIIDERTITEQKPMKIKIGDAEVDLSDSAAVAVAIGTLNATLADAQSKLGAATAELAIASTTIQAKDGEIAALNTQLADAKVTPAKLNEMIAARAKVIDAAKAMGVEPDGDESEADIKKKAVTKKMGDAAASMSDAAIDGAFMAFAANPGSRSADPLRDAIRNQPVNIGDAQAEYEAARAKQKNELRDAWRQPASAAA